MSQDSTPSTMRIWKYSSAAGGIEKHLTLHTSEPLPKPKPDHHLVQVLAVGLNPVDFKPAEAPFLGSIAVKKPATPGFDFAGRIVQPANNSKLQPGQMICGAAGFNPLVGGALAEYIAAPEKMVVALPAEVSPLDAAGAPVAAITALMSLRPYVRSGSRVFLNGGSGGVGTYGIQIAKCLGAHVTVSCSTRNVELCRSLGADEVLDYTARPLLEQLRDASKQSRPFDHVVDNVFSDPGLCFQAHTYTAATAAFAEVASAPTLAFLRFAMGAFLLPGFLGGGRRKFALIAADAKQDDLEQITSWLADKTIRTVTDQVFPFEDVSDAYRKLKTGRASGKVVVSLMKEDQ